MNIENILKSKINKDKIYQNIVNNSGKSDILKVVIPLSIVFIGGAIFYKIRKEKLKW